MNIAIAFPGCHRRGGVERVVYECARHLALRQHTVTVFSADWEADGAAPVRYESVPTRDWPKALRPVSFFRRCSEALDFDAFDVVSTHGCVCPLDGVHWVQSVHRAWLERCAQFRPRFSLAGVKQRLNPLHSRILRLEERHFRERRYRRLVVTTARVAGDLHRHYGVPIEDMEILPNGFSPTEFNPELRRQRRDEVRQRLGLGPGHVALLFVANELERKGYGTLLEAMKRLGRDDLRLLVVGRPDRRQVARLAAEAGLADQVIACGATSQVADFHAAADLFVLPTQYEAFSLAILESLGSGLPVVTTQIPGAHDAIHSGVNGLLVRDPTDGDELAEVLSRAIDPKCCQQLSENAPGTVKEYQWPSILDRYEKILLSAAQIS